MCSLIASSYISHDFYKEQKDNLVFPLLCWLDPENYYPNFKRRRQLHCSWLEVLNPFLELLSTFSENSIKLLTWMSREIRLFYFVEICTWLGAFETFFLFSHVDVCSKFHLPSSAMDLYFIAGPVLFTFVERGWRERQISCKLILVIGNHK